MEKTPQELELDNQIKALRERQAELRRERQQAAREEYRRVVSEERAKRPGLVAQSAAMVLTGKEYPAFPDFQSFATAAYNANGATQDQFFGREERAGFLRFKRALNSDNVRDRLFEDHHMVIHESHEGLGIMTREMGLRKAQWSEDRLASGIRNHNSKVERYNAVLGTEIRPIEVKLLTE